MPAPAATAEPDARSTLPCATCGYDLRAHPRDGICPECETPVEKAIEFAAIPLRPAWRDSDPRWRRRMLAGAWVMVLIPLVAALQTSGLASRVTVPFTNYAGDLTLADSFFAWVYSYLAFCTGIVLFFSKERYRRRNPLDWTRRWGVIVSYVVLLLGVPMHAVLAAMVMVGIGASFMSLPLENQPAVTELLTKLGADYLLYGPHGSDYLYVVVAAFSACAVLLACVPIYDALRCSGPKALALVLLAPLALIAVSHIGTAALSCLNDPLTGSTPWFFFEPSAMLGRPPDLASIINGHISPLLSFTTEAAKWLVFLAVALWLSVAQARAWRKFPTREPRAIAPQSRLFHRRAGVVSARRIQPAVNPNGMSLK